MDTKSDVMQILSERDALLVQASTTLAEIANTAIYSLPVTTQNMLHDMITGGTGQLAITVILNPWPTFIGCVLTGPDTAPIEIFRVQPAQGSLPTATKETAH